MNDPDALTAPGENGENMYYEFDLPGDGKTVEYRHNNDGEMIDLKITDSESGHVDYHHTEKDGPIKPETLRRELAGLKLQEMSIASVLEKHS
jgi:hypothetical protein